MKIIMQIINFSVFRHLFALYVFIGTFFSVSLYAQTLPLPYEIINASEYADSDVYVGLVGKIAGKDVWMDMASGEIHEMALSDNTLQGPIYRGNRGPGGSGLYANAFTRLSDIPDKTINIPQIYAVRIFFAFESPLYLYFFGDGGGYSAPSLSNDSDPNLGIRYELVELTYGSNGLWTNTTRVDAYQYPMGLEVWGSDGFYKRVGEVLSHDDILRTWQSQVSSAFQSAYDEALGIILNPSKAPDFQEGAAQNDYFSDYVSAVWNRYQNEDLFLSIGEAGVWKGRVKDDQFIFTNQTNGVVGMITAQPNTLEILEASGVLAEEVAATPDVDADKNIQKHFSAAFNRGAIDLNAPSGELVEWSDANNYFKNETHNAYVAFWHDENISFEGETYAFAYDDVFDYSSTIQSTVPTKVKITLGGFVDDPYVAGSSIALSQTELDLSSSESAEIDAYVFPLNATNPTIIWETSDKTIATVNNGLITAINSGTTTITARNWDNSVKAICTVNVDGGDASNEFTLHIEAENFSQMSGIQTQYTSDSGGGLNVGWIDTGDYLDYEIEIIQSGTYTLSYRVASLPGGAKVAFIVDGETLINTNIDSTAGWQTWATLNTKVELTSGNHTVRLLSQAANWNINWFELTPDDNASTPPENIRTNIALGKTISASSQEHNGTLAGYAIDGNNSSRWSSAHSDNQWLQVDLGQAYDISRVKIFWETAMAQNYDIQISNDASNWITIQSIANNSQAENDFDNLHTTARYVRIYGYTRATVWGFSIYELEIYGVDE